MQYVIICEDNSEANRLFSEFSELLYGCEELGQIKRTLRVIYTNTGDTYTFITRRIKDTYLRGRRGCKVCGASVFHTMMQIFINDQSKDKKLSDIHSCVEYKASMDPGMNSFAILKDI